MTFVLFILVFPELKTIAGHILDAQKILTT